MLLLVFCVFVAGARESRAGYDENVKVDTVVTEIDEAPDIPEESEDTILPEESVSLPEIQYPEADGRQGYYLFFPDIRIRHREPEAVTKYRLLSADGNKTEGSLEGKEGETSEVLLEGKCMSEGENILRIWMEEKEESSQEPMFLQEVSFLVDTQKPAPVLFLYDPVPSGECIFANAPVEIMIKSGEKEEDVEQICYRTENGDWGNLPAEGGTVLLQPGFRGRVEAYALDCAGNRSELTISCEIFCENTPPAVQMYVEGGTDFWHTGPVAVQVNVRENPEETGIRSVTCYGGGRILWQEHIEQAGRFSLENNFIVDLVSEGGAGIPVTVEATDWAGNAWTETRTILVDTAAPVIQSEGIYDQMISAEPVSGKIWIQEENGLDYEKIEIWRTSPSGKREYLEIPGNGAKGTEGGVDPTKRQEWEISLVEDGIYEIAVTVRDLSGHEIKQQYRITVDGTSPVIRYVNQMQGAYVPYFQWNYGTEEMFWDFTEYSYEMRLDDRFYAPGKRVTQEGRRKLQVAAVDAAGNRSVAEAVFQIDHTPPNIRIYNVEDGKTYEDAVEMSMSVEGEGEYLKEIQINSEEMHLEEACQVFRKSFQEPGEYKIRIRAEDPAGNQEQRQLTFQIKEKGAESIWSPVKKIFQREESSAEESAGMGYEKKEVKEIPAAGVAMLLLPAAVLFPILKRSIVLGKRK